MRLLERQKAARRPRRIWKIADNPKILADKWGIIPAVQPIAAAMLARQPRKRPADTVYITPVPGIRTTTRDVIKNSVLNIFSPVKIHGICFGAI